MKKEVAIEGLIRYVSAVKRSVPVSADTYRYRYRSIVKSSVLSSLVHAHLGLGMYAHYIDHDPQRFRQEFYVASMLELRRYSAHGVTEFALNTVLAYALLSDCRNVIEEAALLEVPEHIEHRDDPRASNFLLHMYQLAVLGDEDALRKKIAVGAERSGKSFRDEFASGTDFFSLLLARDKKGLEARITKLTKIPTRDASFEGLMALGATKEAKICWLKGIEVQIDSPMLPMELMPHQPLPQYDNVYDFLEPGWKPPLPGVLGKLMNRLRR
jgi:Immunity protein 49